MKKFLLFGALSVSLMSNAQGFGYAEDFMVGTASDNYSLGSIHNQQGWQALSYQGVLTSGYNVVNVIPEAVENFPPALAITRDENFDPSPNGTTFGCISPSIANGYIPEAGSSHFKILIFSDDNIETLGSTYTVQMLDLNNAITSAISFHPDGSIKVLESTIDGETYADTGFLWSSGQPLYVTIEYNFIEGTIIYRTGVETLYTGNLGSGISMERFAFLHNNVEGSASYIDALFAFGGVLGLNKTTVSKLILSPNPANNVINISNSNQYLIDNIIIADISGRNVKSVKCNNQIQTQIDVSDLLAGTYILTANFSNHISQVSKIIKN